MLATALGYKVVTTSSPRNFELVKSLGAIAAFSYSDPSTPERIKEWAQEAGFGGIQKAYDTISEQGSTQLVADALAANGKVVILRESSNENPWRTFNDCYHPVPVDKVEPSSITLAHILLYDALDLNNKPEYNLIVEWNKRLPELIESGKFGGAGTVPLRHFDGGLDGVLEALDVSRQGKVSGRKLVVRILAESVLDLRP